MGSFVLHGNIIDSESPERLRVAADSYLVCEEGRCTGVFSALPERFSGLPLTDFGDRLILPGMTDLHLHAPQFAFRGLGMDMELLEWLNTYTFPEESKYKELEYADRAYGSFVNHLLHSTTTRAAIFATIHLPATLLLMQKLEDAGLSTYVGKVNMNRNSPVYLREISTNQALRDTERWLCETKEAYRTVKPILALRGCRQNTAYPCRAICRKTTPRSRGSGSCVPARSITATRMSSLASSAADIRASWHTASTRTRTSRR